jgi:hypothetical protein
MRWYILKMFRWRRPENLTIVLFYRNNIILRTIIAGTAWGTFQGQRRCRGEGNKAVELKQPQEQRSIKNKNGTLLRESGGGGEDRK